MIISSNDHIKALSPKTKAVISHWSLFCSGFHVSPAQFLLAFCANVMKIDSHLISDRFVYFSKCFAGITGFQIDPINNSFAHFYSLTLTEQWTFSARPSNVTGFGAIFSQTKHRLDVTELCPIFNNYWSLWGLLTNDVHRVGIEVPKWFLEWNITFYTL